MLLIKEEKKDGISTSKGPNKGVLDIVLRVFCPRLCGREAGMEATDKERLRSFLLKS